MDIRKFLIDNRVTSFQGMGGVCSYVIESKDALGEPSFRQQARDICHARAFPDVNNRAVAVHSSLYRDSKVPLEQAEEYWDLLFDKERSPFRKYITDFTIHRDDKKEMVGFSTTSVDIPTLVMMNFLFATRLPYEHGNLMKIMKSLCKRGLDMYEALAVVHTGSIINDSLRTWAYPQSHVFTGPFRQKGYDADQYALISPALLRSGSPVIPKGSAMYTTRNQPRQRGIPDIWCDEKLPTFVDLFGKMCNKHQYKGFFRYSAMADVELQKTTVFNNQGVPDISLDRIVEGKAKWSM